MKYKRTTVLFLLFSTLNLIVAAQEIITREEWNKLARKGVVNMIPDSSFKTISRRLSLSGQVLSICEGVDGHWGTETVGVIVIKSTKDNFTYCILTNNSKKYNYQVGEIVKIKVFPLKKTDRYFVPRQLTCTSLKGNVICITN